MSHARHPKKYNDDGTNNEKWKPRASGRSLSKFDRAEFIAWDGEGCNVGNPVDGVQRHVYVYLANSLGDHIYNPDGLSTDAILSFLCDVGAKFPKAMHVLFGGSYDMNCTIRDLCYDKAVNLCDESNEYGVMYKNYELKYVQRKQLNIKRFADRNRKFAYTDTGKYKAVLDGSITLWDVIGFFQSSFVSGVEKWLGSDWPDLKLIVEGKAQRHSFADVNIEYIEKYNAAELRTLVALMKSLQQSLLSLDLKITRWDGAGSIAAAMCKKHGVKSVLGSKEEGDKWQRHSLPSPVQEAAQHAYFGGRVEMGAFGYHKGTIYHYDINSAYPAAQVDLPPINAGKWRFHLTPNIKKLYYFSLILVRWSCPNARFAPFPYRSALQKKILYPTQGENWVWKCELDAALEAITLYPWCKHWKIDLIEAWEFIPKDKSARPYDFMREYYAARAAMVNETKTTGKLNGMEKAIKLGVNSMYGKTAQHTGYKKGSLQLPAYHNLAYAGYITAATRAKLFTAAIQNPDAIIALATDGVFSTSPLSLPISETKELGLWESTTHDGMILVQSGFYWIDTGGEWFGWSRGFDKVTADGETKEERKRNYQQKMRVQIDTVMSAYAKGKTQVFFPCTRFITIKSAKINETWFNRWCTWYSLGHDEVSKGKQLTPGRALKLYPYGTKRTIDDTIPTKKLQPHKNLILTRPTDNATPGELSYKYILPWDSDLSDTPDLDGVPITVVNEESEDGWI